MHAKRFVIIKSEQVPIGSAIVHLKSFKFFSVRLKRLGILMVEKW